MHGIQGKVVRWKGLLCTYMRYSVYLHVYSVGYAVVAHCGDDGSDTIMIRMGCFDRQ